MLGYPNKVDILQMEGVDACLLAQREKLFRRISSFLLGELLC